MRDSRDEEPADLADPRQTSAFVRTFLRAPAAPDTVTDWYDERLTERGWRLVQAPSGHPQHYRRYRRDNMAFNLFVYDESPFREDRQGVPGPSAFRAGETVHQLFLEARKGRLRRLTQPQHRREGHGRFKSG